jgi:hypothetical protein
VQVGLLAIALLAIDGKVSGVPGRTTGPPFAQLGFIDRATGDGQVTWVDNQPRRDEYAASKMERTALLYNDGIRQRIAAAKLAITLDDFPLNGLRLGLVDVAADGQLRVAQGIALGPIHDVVDSVGSPFLQLDGRTLARGPVELGYEVKRLAQPVRAGWYTTGLTPAAILPRGKQAQLQTWGDRSVRVTLDAPDAATQARLSFGGRTQTVDLPRGASRVVTVTACGGGTGTLDATAPVRVFRVDLAPGRCG